MLFDRKHLKKSKKGKKKKKEKKKKSKYDDDAPGDIPIGETSDWLKEKGQDPMDIHTEKEALFGWSLLFSEGVQQDRSKKELEEEMEYVASKLDEYGIEHKDPLDFSKKY